MLGILKRVHSLWGTLRWLDKLRGGGVVIFPYYPYSEFENRGWDFQIWAYRCNRDLRYCIIVGLRLGVGEGVLRDQRL